MQWQSPSRLEEKLNILLSGKDVEKLDDNLGEKDIIPRLDEKLDTLLLIERFERAKGEAEKAKAAEQAKSLDILTNNNTSFFDTFLSCEIAQDTILRDGNPPPMLNFFSSAVGQNYEDLLPLYTYFALSTHRQVGRAVSELVVPNRKMFIARHILALDWLQEEFSYKGAGSICVREYKEDHIKRTNTTNTWRYLEVPTLRAKYTYIGDVDLFLTESVLDPKRFEQMKEFKIPYSNIVRDYSAKYPRLTGLMLLETEGFYTDALLKAQATIPAGGNDEAFLYKIVVEAGIGIPPSNSTSPLLKYRPGHGVHLSMNRGPGKLMCTRSKKEFDKLFSVDNISDYLLADPIAKDYLSHTEAIIEEQTKGNYKVIDNKCQPTNSTT